MTVNCTVLVSVIVSRPDNGVEEDKGVFTRIGQGSPFWAGKV